MGVRPLPVPPDADAVLVSQGGTLDSAGNAGLRRLGSDLTARQVPFVVLCHSVTNVPASELDRPRVVRFLSQATEVGFLTQSLRTLTERVVGHRLVRSFTFANPLKNYDAIPWPQIGDDTLRIALVGQANLGVKGQGDLLQLFESRSWRSRDWFLTLAGSGPDIDKLRTLVKDHPARMQIRLMGHVDDIPALWARNHLLVLPSRVEALPSTLLEAMLASRPAVVTAVGAMPEVVQHGRSGWLAASPAPSDLAPAMEAMWEARDQLQQIGQKARARALRFAVRRPDEALLDRIVSLANRPG